MKRLMIMAASLAVFGGAAYYGSTGAFFSDAETSTGNVFTAGSIDLTVDSTQHYNNAVCTSGTWQLEADAIVQPDQYPVIGSACDGTWDATNLGAAQKFFNFGDIKPADQGEDTVSLHLTSNPAWACLDIGTNANNENGINNPESKAGDVTPDAGELAQNVHVIGWLDNGAGGGTAGDNIWQVGEPQLFASTPLSGFNSTTTLALADSQTNGGQPLNPSDVNYVGLYWCAGTITGGAGSLACDGSTMGNDTQTDSATSTVSFRVEQSRNNPNFTCGASTEPEGDVFSESFENGGNADWTNFSVNVPNIDTHVPSGMGGIPASDGSFFASTTGDAFTHWGTYSSIFPAGGYTTQVDVYLDMSKVTTSASDTGYFDFTSAINKQDGNHLRDYIFHVGHNPAGAGSWAVTVSNNSSDDSSLPQADQPQNTLVDPYQVTTTGWYTLQSYFHDNGSGVLAVTMNLLNQSGTVLHTWTLSDPSDVIATTVGGHRYGWFSAQPFELAFDKARYYLGLPN